MKLRAILIQTVVLGALALASGAALAQSITFFERQNFQGRSFSQNNAVPNFNRWGFNDRPESVIVRRGTWQLCTDAGFRGNCVTLRPGSYPNLWSMGLGNRVSSARPFGAGMPPPPPPMPGPGPGPWRPPAPGGNAAVTLFDGFNLSGNVFRVDFDVPDLDRTQWNDRARSMIVRSGTWQLCSDAFFRNNCQVFPPGRYDSLGGLNGTLSSLRRVR